MEIIFLENFEGIASFSSSSRVAVKKPAAILTLDVLRFLFPFLNCFGCDVLRFGFLLGVCQVYWICGWSGIPKLPSRFGDLLGRHSELSIQRVFLSGVTQGMLYCSSIEF